MIFFDQFKVPTVKFGKRFAEFMIPIDLPTDEDSTDTMFCMTVGDPWIAKEHHWKSEAKDV